MRRPARNEPALCALVALLTDGRFVTAAQVAAETGCSKMVAHLRLRALRARGHEFQTRRVREGSAGPESTAYAIVSLTCACSNC